MSYKLLISNSAFNDLDNIKAFIAIDDVGRAKDYIAKIFDRLETLSDLPYRGLKIQNHIFDYANVYYFICLNHVAIYQIDELAKCIYIVRVLSHYQDWKNIVNKELLAKEEAITQSDRLLIVKMNQSMTYDVYRNSLDEDNRKYVPDEVFNTLEEASDVVNFIMDSYQNEEGPFIYALLRKEDNVNIGYVQLVKIDEGWEIGYHIAKLFTKRGYATEAVNAFLEYLKTNRNLDEIYGIALAANKASRKVLQKCGFNLVYEGNGIYQGRRRKIIKTIKKMR